MGKQKNLKAAKRSKKKKNLKVRKKSEPKKKEVAKLIR